MGKYNDFLNSQIGLLAGPFPYGSTLVPTSEFVPIVLAQNVKGGTFSVPDTESLVNIPYELLMKDMEIVVSAHNLPGPVIVPRKKYFLKTMPPAGIRVDEIVGFDINTMLDQYWTLIETPEVIEPEDGEDGDDAWTPHYANVPDGANRVVQRLIAYTGGSGDPPVLDPTQNYLGPNGLTTINNATNIKGPQGDAALVRPIVNNESGDFTEDALSVTQTNTNGFYLVRTFNITNNFSSARDFLVRATMHYSRVAGGNSVYVVTNLKYREALPPIGLVGTNWTPNSEYKSLESRRDLIDCPLYTDAVLTSEGTDQMVELQGTVKVPAGASWSFYLSVRCIPDGFTATSVRRSIGRFRVIGL